MRLDEASFFEFLQDYIEALESDQRKFKQDEDTAIELIRTDAAEFEAREVDHIAKIKDLEAVVFEISADIIKLRKKLDITKDHDQDLGEKIIELQKVMAEEEITFVKQVEEAQQEIVNVKEEKELCKLNTSIVVSDLKLMQEENRKLREHIDKFQKDVSNVIYG